MNRIAEAIDLAVLSPTRSREAVLEACKLAEQYNMASVCVQPCDVSTVRQAINHFGLTISTVIGFPHGEQPTNEKVTESLLAGILGASELDVVMNLYGFKNGNYESVKSELMRIVRCVKPTPVKVIIETGLWTTAQIVTACEIAEGAGAAYVKTCTGFGPRGATPEDIDIMINSTSLPVKASGGIKTLAQAEAYLDQGCRRLGIGLESAKQIMKELVC